MFDNIFSKTKPEHKMEIQVQKKQQIEKELVGKIIPHENHTVWEICLNTEKIKKATYVEKKEFINFGELSCNENKEILVREGFAYVSALNKKNALKKFKKNKNGSKNLSKEPLKLNIF